MAAACLLCSRCNMSTRAVQPPVPCLTESVVCCSWWWWWCGGDDVGGLLVLLFVVVVCWLCGHCCCCCFVCCCIVAVVIFNCWCGCFVVVVGVVLQRLKTGRSRARLCPLGFRLGLDALVGRGRERDCLFQPRTSREQAGTRTHACAQ